MIRLLNDSLAMSRRYLPAAKTEDIESLPGCPRNCGQTVLRKTRMSLIKDESRDSFLTGSDDT
jgi:hypothetical protein